MNEILDIALLAAKVATIKNEKARLAVEATSVAINATQWARYQSMIRELNQIINYVDLVARYRGWCTQEEFNLASECRTQIEECCREAQKYGVMTILDGLSLLWDGFSQLNRK